LDGKHIPYAVVQSLGERGNPAGAIKEDELDARLREPNLKK
jgi:hypothetical protein